MVRFGISEAVMGLTVVALGTSLPELAVLIAGLVGQGGVAVGKKVSGSNVMNILGIISFCIS